MRLESAIRIEAPPGIIFGLAAEVERWPALLPHYRAVRVFRRRGLRKLVWMAAWRGAIPVAWTSIQEPRPGERRILFRHVRGATRGMLVEWRLTPLSNGETDVRIVHEFNPGWPLVGGRLAELVIGEFFVQHIAGKTLRRIKQLAETQADLPRAKAGA